MPSRTIRPAEAPVDAPFTYVLGAQENFTPEAISVSWGGFGATGAFLASVSFYDPSGVLIGRAFPETPVQARGRAEVSYYPFRRHAAAAAGAGLPRNMVEIGIAFADTLSATLTCPVTFDDVEPGDGILVMAEAPSRSALAATPGRPQSATDTAGNAYTVIASSRFEANPPNVNQGVSVSWLWCPLSQARLAKGAASISVTWSQPVYDRTIWAWMVRYDGGASTPRLLNVTADNDAAVYAQNFVTLASPGWTPTRNNGLTFAYLTAAGPGGVGGWGGIAGWTGFFQAAARLDSSARQAYFRAQQTHGADVYLVVKSLSPQYQLSLGSLPANVPELAFNGVGQVYSSGANMWKGVTLWAID